MFLLKGIQSKSEDTSKDLMLNLKKKGSNGTIPADSDVDFDDLAFTSREIWMKDLRDLPVAQDLPRLARKIRILDTTGEVANFVEEHVHNQTPEKKESKPPQQTPTVNVTGKTQEQQGLSRTIFSILTTLAQETGESSGNGIHAIGTLTMELFEREINIEDLSSINGFLLRYFGEHGKVTKILKATNQSIVAPAVTQLKKALMKAKVDYKDVKGGWTIDIVFSEESACVKHHKTEQVFAKAKGGKQENLYQFEWLLVLNFDMPSDDNKFELRSTRVKLVDVSFNGEVAMTEQAKAEAKQLLVRQIQDRTLTYDEKFLAMMAKKKKK